MKVSSMVQFLEEAYDEINKYYFESALSKIAITIQSTPGAYGHFTPYDAWKDGEKNYKEININAGTLNRKIEETIATLIHEMVHFYCHIRGINDVSRNNTYHNKNFKAEAEKRGLIIEYDKRIGWSVTKPSESLTEFIQRHKWEDKLMMYRKGGEVNDISKTKKQSSTRKYICPCCGMSVRATKDVRIKCMDCDKQMEKKEDN